MAGDGCWKQNILVSYCLLMAEIILLISITSLQKYIQGVSKKSDKSKGQDGCIVQMPGQDITADVYIVYTVQCG